MSDTIASLETAASNLCVTINPHLASIVEPFSTQNDAQGDCGFPPVISMHPDLSLAVHNHLRGSSCRVRPSSYL